MIIYEEKCIAHTECSLCLGSLIFRCVFVNGYKVHVVCITLMGPALSCGWEPAKNNFFDHKTKVFINPLLFDQLITYIIFKSMSTKDFRDGGR